MDGIKTTAFLAAALCWGLTQAQVGNSDSVLNSNIADEIMLFSGMNNRMTHEFEEYRPYTSLEQFRREIGKYVDEDEVARFERYMTLD